MAALIRKKHNVSLLLYHIVCPAKYRRAVFTPLVGERLKEICEGISRRYEIEFLEIGTDQDHVHFLVQSVPSYSPKKIVHMKSEEQDDHRLVSPNEVWDTLSSQQREQVLTHLTFIIYDLVMAQIEQSRTGADHGKTSSSDSEGSTRAA